MAWVFVLLALVVLIVIGVAMARRNRMAAGDMLSYESVKPLSAPEQVLYWRLLEALPECVVLPQVTFSRFMKPDTGGVAPKEEYHALQNRISQKTIDFLVCLKDFTVVAAIELDDATHKRDADERRDQILRAAGVVVIRLRTREMPTIEKLRELFTAERAGDRA